VKIYILKAHSVNVYPEWEATPLVSYNKDEAEKWINEPVGLFVKHEYEEIEVDPSQIKEL
jgi:hypothetical protein